jgi:hypothetical protein
MNHPFKIGETYENMKGGYTVLSISPPAILRLSAPSADVQSGGRRQTAEVRYRRPQFFVYLCN